MKINLFDYRITTLVTPELFDAYEKAPVFAFDIETDADDYHWDSGERGLSYASDCIMISFYAPGLPAVVLYADTVEDRAYSADVYNPLDGVYEYSDHRMVLKKGGKKQPDQWISEPLVKPVYGWTTVDQNFIRMMFSRPEYTAIAHNLVFDARHIFGKLLPDLDIPDGAILWDTQVIELTGNWLKPVGDEDYVGASLEGLTQHLLSEESLAFWSKMKDFRTKLKQVLYFPTEKLPTKDEAVLYSAFDSILAYQLYLIQNSNENNHKWYSYPEGSMFENLDSLIEWEVEYTKWCVEQSAIGIPLNLEHVRSVRDKAQLDYLELLPKMGLELATEPMFRNKEWIKNFVFSNVPEDDRPTQAEIRAHKLLTKKAAWSFGKEQIAFYIKRYGEGPLSIFAEATKLETVISMCNEFIRHAEYDGRIHSLLSRNTITSRNSSSSPNLQNLDFSKVAGMLIAEPGKVLVEQDYSNCENWMQAVIAQDNVYATTCAQVDFHAAMIPVWGLSHLPPKEARLYSKRMTFGTSYGMGQEKLANSINVSKEEAQRLLDEKDRQFARTAVAKKNSKKFAELKGYTILWTGRQVSIKQWEGKYKGYTAWNSLAQGGVAEMVARAIVLIRRWLRQNGFKSRVAMQVHDSLVIAYLLEEYEIVAPMIIEIMATVMPEEWRNRTTPACRFLTDIDHPSNSKKWGYVPGQEYPLDKMTYMNRWGVHQHGPDTWSEKEGYKAPVWINEFGWGQEALDKELGLETAPVHMPGQQDKPRTEVSLDEVDWNALQAIVGEVNSTFSLFEHKGSLYGGVNKLKLQRELCHRGHENSYLAYLEIYGKLCEIVERDLKPFIEKSGGQC